MQSRILGGVFVAALVACHSVGSQSGLLPAANGITTAISPEKCRERVNDTLAKLEECIQRAALWHDLAHFQQIADENPGPLGHASRDTGTPGYAASVAYVANLMRAAGYKVTIQRYNYKKEEVIGAPEFQARGHVGAPAVSIDLRSQHKSDVDYNLIADSPFGDPHSVVVIDAHLDAIYGAGMLDNASGSTTILEVALNMAKTHTRNRLRYVWFGGEELGLLGSRYYTAHLSRTEVKRIVFDVDADVTATPNFDILIADPANASKVKHFPRNVVPQSRIGNQLFADFFNTGGVVSRPAGFGNDGTDSLSFSLAGVPNSGILTGQDCCKRLWETRLWGGYRGDYDGVVPGFSKACVDRPKRWCDDLSNNDPFVLELTSKAVAYVTFKLANRHLP
ncbi:MAG TPA: M28 family peptidase [Candidatus Cybelea sp.]|nr:M28 family peptidase [Candidatus Cybelea sp.]